MPKHRAHHRAVGDGDDVDVIVVDNDDANANANDDDDDDDADELSPDDDHVKENDDGGDDDDDDDDDDYDDDDVNEEGNLGNCDDESAKSDDTDDLVKSIMGSRPPTQPVPTKAEKRRRSISRSGKGGDSDAGVTSLRSTSNKKARTTRPSAAPTKGGPSKNGPAAAGRRKPPRMTAAPAADGTAPFGSHPVEEESDDGIVIGDDRRSHATSDDEGDGAGDDGDDTFEVSLPPHLFGGAAASSSAAAADCTLMVQVDPEDAALLDYEGVSGAIGRFEANDMGIVLDLRGCQYHGSIVPGPTALVLGFVGSKPGEVGLMTACMRVEAVTDEFAALVRTNDLMGQLDAVVGGEMEHGGFQLLHDENVNYAPSRHNNDGTCYRAAEQQQLPAMRSPSNPNTSRVKKGDKGKNCDSSAAGGGTAKKDRRLTPKAASSSAGRPSSLSTKPAGGVRRKR